MVSVVELMGLCGRKSAPKISFRATIFCLQIPLLAQFWRAIVSVRYTLRSVSALEDLQRSRRWVRWNLSFLRKGKELVMNHWREAEAQDWLSGGHNHSFRGWVFSRQKWSTRTENLLQYPLAFSETFEVPLPVWTSRCDVRSEFVNEFTQRKQFWRLILAKKEAHFPTRRRESVGCRYLPSKISFFIVNLPLG